LCPGNGRRLADSGFIGLKQTLYAPQGINIKMSRAPLCPAQGPPKPEIIRRQGKQRQNIVLGQRACKAAKKPMIPRPGDEIRQRRVILMTAQSARLLVSRIEHDSDQAICGKGLNGGEIRRFIGEHHGDNTRPARRLDRQRLKACAPAFSPFFLGKKPHLDEIDAAPGGAANSGGQYLGFHRQIADRRAGGPAAPHQSDGGIEITAVPGPQRPLGRVLEIQHIGARRDGEGVACFGQCGQAGKQDRHLSASPFLGEIHRNIPSATSRRFPPSVPPFFRPQF